MTTNHPVSLTAEQVAEIQARLDGITPWPWEADVTEPHDMVVWGKSQHSPATDQPESPLIINIGEPIARVGDVCGSTADAEFIAHAPTDIAALLADRSARGEEVERLRAALTQIANESDDPDDWQPFDEFNDPVDTDITNGGDMRRHGQRQARWQIAKIARAALATLTEPSS